MFVKKLKSVMRIYGGVIYRENFKLSTFREIMKKLFTSKQNNADEKKCFIANVS